MPFEFEDTSIDGLLLVHPRIFPDERGYFLETYKQSEFLKAGIGEDFVQDNHSYSFRGVVRGLHFQNSPHAQGKLVRALNGVVWDVAVDLRKDSETFGQWKGFELDGGKGTLLYLPPGFAHGFTVLSETAHLLYKCTDEYNAASDSGVRWDDPDIGVEWPVKSPVISGKDEKLPYLKELKS